MRIICKQTVLQSNIRVLLMAAPNAVTTSSSSSLYPIIALPSLSNSSAVRPDVAMQEIEPIGMDLISWLCLCVGYIHLILLLHCIHTLVRIIPISLHETHYQLSLRSLISCILNHDTNSSNLRFECDALSVAISIEFFAHFFAK